MGSLMPGWSMDVAKGEQEQEDTEEETKGYFAKLEKKRSLRHRDASDDSAFLPSELPRAFSLERRSLPLEGASATPTSTPTNAEPVTVGDAPPPRTSPSAAAAAAAAHSHMLHSATLPLRTTTVPSSIPRISPRLSRISAPACHGTDWASELSSLGGQKASPVGSAPAMKPSSAWWSRMDSGALNRRPDVEITRAHSGDASGFIPQYAITGQKLPPCMMAQNTETQGTEAKEKRQQ